MRPEPDNPFEPAPPARPPRSYVPAERVLVLPRHLPIAVAEALGPATGVHTEGGALLYGRRSSDGTSDVVTGFVIPEQIRNQFNYTIPGPAITAASVATRDRGWVVLAQVHTHPGPGVEHSWYDDRNAISAKALSLVAPYYGADPGRWLTDVGVHEFQIDWWHLLTGEQAAARVALADVPLTTLDLRSAASLTGSRR